jgi:hypothetical protein
MPSRRGPFVRSSAAAVAGSQAPGAGLVPASSRLGARDRDSIGFSLPAPPSMAARGVLRPAAATQARAGNPFHCDGRAFLAGDWQRKERAVSRPRRGGNRSPMPGSGVRRPPIPCSAARPDPCQAANASPRSPPGCRRSSLVPPLQASLPCNRWANPPVASGRHAWRRLPRSTAREPKRTVPISWPLQNTVMDIVRRVATG